MLQVRLVVRGGPLVHPDSPALAGPTVGFAEQVQVDEMGQVVERHPWGFSRPYRYLFESC